MRLPVVRGLIERRLLVNFRVDPAVVQKLVPEPFEPKLAGDFAVAGICLIRLKQIRPRGVPAVLGIGSENAAHRIAVTWDEDGQRREGVYIPRRDSSSRLNAVVGGRIFPGIHHHAHFDVWERADSYHVAFTSDDGSASVLVEGSLAKQLPFDSVFGSIEEASAFFEGGSTGYSPSSQPDKLDGLELRVARWHVDPLAITRVEASYFSDRSAFPEGSVAFDHALLMRDIEHEWHEMPVLLAKNHGYTAPTAIKATACSLNNSWLEVEKRARASRSRVLLSK